MEARFVTILPLPEDAEEEVTSLFESIQGRDPAMRKWGRFWAWSPEELQELRDAYGSQEVTLEELQNLLPRRSTNAIRCKASELGLHRPTYNWRVTL